MADHDRPFLPRLHVAVDGIALSLDDAAHAGGELEPLGFRLRGGVGLSRHLGVELHAAFTRSDDDVSFDRVDMNLYGAYLTAAAPLGPFVSLTGLAGFSGVGIEQYASRQTGGGRFESERNGFGFGVGLEAAIGPRVDLTADWMRYLSDDGPASDSPFDEITSLAVGLKVRFP